MNDEFDFFETEYDEIEHPVTVPQKRVRKGAQPVRTKSSKGSQKVTLLSLSVVLLGIVLIISLLFQFSINGRYEALTEALNSADLMADGEDGSSLVSRVSELENTMTAINTRLDQIAGSMNTGTPDEVTADSGTDEIDQETQDRTTQQIQQGTVVTPDTSANQTTASSASTKEYTIKDGDNPWVISNTLFGDSSKVQEIMDLNGLTEETVVNLAVGQVIKVPAN